MSDLIRPTTTIVDLWGISPDYAKDEKDRSIVSDYGRGAEAMQQGTPNEDNTPMSEWEMELARCAAEAMRAACIAAVESMDIHGCHSTKGIIDCNCIGTQVVAALKEVQP